MLIERHLVFWTLFLAFLVAALYVLGDVLFPFAAGMALAYLLDPLATRLERYGLSRLMASLVILGLALLVFVLLLLAVIPLLMQQLGAFIKELPGYIGRLQTLAQEQGGLLVERLGFNIFERLGIGKSGAGTQGQASELIAKAGQVAGTFLAGLWSGGQALLGVISLLVVTPVVAFYLLVDWPRMVATVYSWAPVQQRETVRRLAGEMDQAIAGFIRGQTLVCLFLGLWYGIGLTMIGLNFGFLIGIIAGFLSFIPFVGSLAALVVSIAVAIVQDWPSLWLLAMVVVVIGVGQFIEGNILTPRLIGNSVGLHPVWLMFALIAFGSLFGFTGLIVAVPVAAAIGVLARFGVSRYLESEFYQGRNDVP
jgi:predicted PurR-regulated permease PerM